MASGTFFAWVVTAFVVGAIVYNLRTDIRNIVSGRNVVLLGIIAYYLAEALQGSVGTQQFVGWVYNYSMFCVFLAAASFLIGYHGSKGPAFFLRTGVRLSQLDDPKVLTRVVLVCLVLGFTPIVYYSNFDFWGLIRGILGQRKSWGGVLARGRFGDARAAFLMLEYFVLGAGPLAVVLILDRRTSFLSKLACVPIALWPLMRTFGSGTRSAMMLSFLPVMAVFYFKAGPKMQRTMLLASIFGVAPFYTFMAAVIMSRNSGEFTMGSADRVKYVGYEMFNELEFIVDGVPSRLTYQMGKSYGQQLVVPIPRFLWPGKPLYDVGILLAQVKTGLNAQGQTSYTNSPGLIGEMYFNFSVIGVIVISAIGGWFVRGWDRLLTAYSHSMCTMIFYSMGLVALCLLGRSFSAPIFYNMLFLYFGVMLITRKRPSAKPALAMPPGVPMAPPPTGYYTR